jgi:hypothetical protein
MVAIFRLPAYTGDHRGGKIEGAWKRVLPDGSPSENFVDLCCPQEAVDQLLTCFGSITQQVEVPVELETTVSHSLYLEAGCPPQVRDLVYLLKEVVSIPAPIGVDFAIALDWYKKVEDGVDPTEWAETAMGQCIKYTKYATQPTWSTSRAKRRELIRALVGFISRHPLYANAIAISAPPGSAADGQSFAELLAREVAANAGKPYIGQAAAGSRPPQKEGLHQDLSEAFTMNGQVSGTVVVIDDVYRTGSSMSGAALAARRAGASSVLALTAVRTLRN